MSTKALVLALVGTGCVVAAGVGGYVAVRVSTGERVEGAAPAPRPDAAAPTATTPESAAPSTDTQATTTEPRQTTAKSVSAPVTSEPARSERTAQTAAPAAESSAVTASPITTTIPDPPVTDPVTPTTPPVTETAAASEPVKPKLEELTVKEESVIGIRLENSISSETAKLEDKVTARVSRDVTVNSRTAIPAGAVLEGLVTAVDRGGKFKNAARLSIRFTSLVLADNTRVPIQTEALSREGNSPGNEATAKVGAGAVLGAVIGGLIGGKKGAAVGGAAGAASGSAAVAASGRNDVTLPAGTALTVKLTAPVTLMIERDQSDIR